MKRNSLKKIASLMSLSLILCSVFNTSVLANNTGSISGSGTVTNAVFNVLIPTKISFLLDPMNYEPTSTLPTGIDAQTQIRIGATGNMPAGYSFVNLSNVPITLNVEATMTLGTGVYLMTQGEVTSSDSLNKDKEAYFAIVPAADAAFKSDGTIDAATFAALAAVAPNVAATGKAGASMNFVLNSAKNSATPADDNAGVAVFAFEGRLNPIADWKENDLTVTMKYTFTGITSTMYTNAKAGFINGALNLASAKNSDVAFTPSYGPFITPSTVTYSGLSLAVAVDLGSGNKAGNSINAVRFFNNGVGVYTAVATTDYTATTKALTFNAGKFTSIPAGTYQIEISFTNGKKAMGTFIKS